MIYRDFKGLKLSGLGLGNMRLPVIDGDDSRIDYEKAAAVIRRAYEGGVNYFDTAYGYHGGTSEATVGRALADVPRDSYYLADKFPGFSLENVSRVREIFEEQLQRCATDHFDFYLFHNIYEKNIDMCLDPQYGIMDYLLEQKRAGRIRHLGFSCHGEPRTLERFLDAGRGELEFCQIQLNYVDWSLQHAREKVELLNSRGIPIWVMEGVRGGRLVDLPAETLDKLKAMRPEESAVSWAFRFLQSVPGVTVVLSGMGSVEQVEDNLATWSEDRPLNEREFAALTEIGRNLFAKGTVPCTACHYCVSKCPQGLDIPRLLRLYNEAVYSGVPAVSGTIKEISPDKQPGACISCHSCAAVCPQNIEIPETLAKFTEMLGTKE